MSDHPDRNPLPHARKAKARLHDLIAHLRESIHEMDDPQAKALFETTAEALGGLVNAFEDYEQQNEAAWDA